MILESKTLEMCSLALGDSFYLLDEPEFSRAFTELKDAFQSEYKNTNIGYSYKTNYIPTLCNAVNKLGGYAEVVSDMEYDLSQKIGVPKNHVFLNGPYKNKQCMKDILENGGYVNADCERDLHMLKEIAEECSGVDLNVGLRCNFDIGDGVLSRFGFCYEDKSLEHAIAYLKKLEGVKIAGFHCHFASRSLVAWEKATAGMLEIISCLEGKLQNELKFVSLGGGLYGEMPGELQAQLGQDIPTFMEYAAASARRFSDYYCDRDDSRKPLLIIEPGTAVAAGALSFVTKLVDLRTVRGTQIFTAAGSSFNFNPSMAAINLPMEIVRNSEARFPDVDCVDAMIVGYTCIEKDILYRGYTGKLSVDDFAVFHQTGSYSVVMKPPFILPNVPIIQLDSSSVGFKILKRQELFEDVFATYNFN
jgi:diaminopimelate decarboxylase